MKRCKIYRVQQYLKQIQNIDDMINRKQEQIDNLRSIATSMQMNTDSDRVQSSGSKDKLGDCCAKIADLQEEINADIDAFVDAKADIMHTVDKLESLEERNILYYRYFKMLPFVAIAGRMCISESTAYRIHHQALCNVSNILYPES
jgi:DNA-directed RNA polymerase specialized sigma subunit